MADYVKKDSSRSCCRYKKSVADRLAAGRRSRQHQLSTECKQPSGCQSSKLPPVQHLGRRLLLVTNELRNGFEFGVKRCLADGTSEPYVNRAQRQR